MWIDHQKLPKTLIGGHEIKPLRKMGKWPNQDQLGKLMSYLTGAVNLVMKNMKHNTQKHQKHHWPTWAMYFIFTSATTSVVILSSGFPFEGFFNPKLPICVFDMKGLSNFPCVFGACISLTQLPAYLHTTLSSWSYSFHRPQECRSAKCGNAKKKQTALRAAKEWAFSHILLSRWRGSWWLDFACLKFYSSTGAPGFSQGVSLVAVHVFLVTWDTWVLKSWTNHGHISQSHHDARRHNICMLSSSSDMFVYP